MDSIWIAVAVGIAFGLFVGSRIAKRSEQDEAIYGGGSAKTLHRLASIALGGAFPAGLLTIFLAHSVVSGIVMGFAFVGTAFVLLILFALVENGPRAIALEDDRGWTEEKARSSGL